MSIMGAQTVPYCALPIVSLIVFFFIVGGLILSRVNEEEGMRVVRKADV
jgi:hypothetical protein